MDRRLVRLAPRVYTLYAWVFVLAGVAGVLLAEREARLYGVLSPSTDLLHQLRFLRGLEAGLGAVLLAGRDAFFAPAPERTAWNRGVLAALFAVPAARTVSLVLDGPPSPWWTGFLVLEWALFIWLRRATEPRGGGASGPHQSLDAS